MKSTEKETQKQIIQFLIYNNIFHWRQNSGALRVRNRFYRFTSINGISDIIILHNGKAIFVEVKDKYGKQSDDQKKFQKEVEKSGNIYILAKSVKDISDIFK